MSLPPLNVPDLLRKAGLRPDKRLGQNFLTDEDALTDIVEAAQIDPSDLILEIGPGVGSLTRHIARMARQVIAVEIDERLMPLLREVLTPYPNVNILQGDILTINLTPLIADRSFKVVANIPYYITSAVIRHLLEFPSPPERIVLTIQDEVAERICAEPGEMSLLALSVQLYGSPQITARIPAQAFYPAPEVDSAVVRIDLFPDPMIAAPLQNTFFRLIKAGFSQKRKTLRNALAGGLAWSPGQVGRMLTTAGIDPMRRAESLSIPEWEKLVKAYSAEKLSS